MRSSVPALSDAHLQVLAAWLGPDPDEASHNGNFDFSAEVQHLVDRYLVYDTVSTLLSQTSAVETNVALQFPDSLLTHAPLITEALDLVTNLSLTALSVTSCRSFLFFILGDTSYGDCCVDEVAAQHLATHVVVHYGTACLSPSTTLPSIYVFPKSCIQKSLHIIDPLRLAVEHVLTESKAQHLVLLYDLGLHSNFSVRAFHHFNSSLLLDSFATPVSVGRLAVQNAKALISPGHCTSTSSERQLIVGPHVVDFSLAPLEHTAFLWLTCTSSSNSTDLIHDAPSIPRAAQYAALTLCTGPVTSGGFFIHRIDAKEDAEPTQVDASRILRRRFAKLRHIEDATRIAIVPGTLGASGAASTIERCKRVIRNSGKRPYVLLVGKPNPAKLANFAEMDVFVLVACPFTSLIDDREYMRPIVTPLELEAALARDGDLFSKPYSTDWRTLFDDSNEDEEILGRNDAVDRVKYDTKGHSALVPRDDWDVTVNDNGTAAEFLQQRTWQGLKYNKGGRENDTNVEDLPVLAEKGQKGRARAYEREGNLED